MTSSVMGIQKFVRNKHSGQKYSDGAEVWHHLLRVAHILRTQLAATQEGSPRERDTIVKAALGHDLLEDTDASVEEVRKLFGPVGSELIMGLTNPEVDGGIPQYVLKVVEGREEVRLIKFADLYDNMTSVCYRLHILGVPWATSYFLPIVSPMKDAIIETSFKRYVETSARLQTMVETAHELLQLAIQIYGNKKSGADERS